MGFTVGLEGGMIEVKAGTVNHREVLDYVRGKGTTTTADVAAEFGLSVDAAHRHLVRAVRRGVLTRDTESKPYVYAVAVAPIRGKWWTPPSEADRIRDLMDRLTDAHLARMDRLARQLEVALGVDAAC